MGDEDRDLQETDDTEGQGGRFPLGETEDDTEGHGSKFPLGETEDDTEGHIRKR